MTATKNILLRAGLASLVTTGLIVGCDSVPGILGNPIGLAIGHALTVSVQGDGSVEPSSGRFASGTELQLTATANRGNVFDHWEGDVLPTHVEDNPLNVVIEADTSLTAVFRAQATLTVRVLGQGVVDPAGGGFDPGMQVLLTATPTNGYVFDRWEGSGVSPAHANDNPLTLVLNSDKSVTAVFLAAHTLTVTIQGEGRVEPLGGQFPAGTEVLLRATADDGFAFAGWEGDAEGSENTASIIMNGDKSVTAVFVARPVLTVHVQGLGQVDPAGGTFDAGSAVTITAEPADGWDFVHWEGDVPPGRAESNPLTITLDVAKAITAVFERGIVPGAAIGPIALDDTFGDVVRLLGSPDWVWPDPYYWLVDFVYDELGLAGALEDIDRDEQADQFEPVILIVAAAPFAGTYRGAGIGSSLGEITDVIGPPEEIDGVDYWYPTRGVVWTIEGDVVTTLGVFHPAPPRAPNVRAETPSANSLGEARRLFRTLRGELAGAR